MVEVFDLVFEVLADDGVLWLNLGDSYANNSQGSGGSSEKQERNAGSRYKTDKKDIDLKPKNILGMPWRVAFAQIGRAHV